MEVINKYVMPLPWCHSLWKGWYRAAQLTKLPHALLLHGPSQSGKTHFIRSFAQLILCSQPKHVAEKNLYISCGKCSSCLWYEASTHPNYYEIKPTASGTGKASILIDQIRELTKALQQTSRSVSSQSAYRTVVVIDPTEALHVFAAPALLKTLEEPLLGVLFILASAKSHALSPTIRSRCQLVKLPQPSYKESSAWVRSQLSKTANTVDEELLTLSLHLANFMPLQALYYLEHNEIAIYQSIVQSLVALGLKTASPGEVSQSWFQYPVEKIVNYLLLATAQLIRLRLGVEVDEGVSHTSIQAINEFANRVSLKYLFHCWDKLQQTRYEMSVSTLNTLLSLEMLAYMFSNSSSFS